MYSRTLTPLKARRISNFTSESWPLIIKIMSPRTTHEHWFPFTVYKNTIHVCMIILKFRIVRKAWKKNDTACDRIYRRFCSLHSQRTNMADMLPVIVLYSTMKFACNRSEVWTWLEFRYKPLISKFETVRNTGERNRRRVNSLDRIRVTIKKNRERNSFARCVVFLYRFEIFQL